MFVFKFLVFSNRFIWCLFEHIVVYIFICVTWFSQFVVWLVQFCVWLMCLTYVCFSSVCMCVFIVCVVVLMLSMAFVYHLCVCCSMCCMLFVVLLDVFCLFFEKKNILWVSYLLFGFQYVFMVFFRILCIVFPFCVFSVLVWFSQFVAWLFSMRCMCVFIFC